MDKVADNRKRIGTVAPLFSLVKEGDYFAAGARFIDWLEKTKQSAWQMLPISQTQLEPGSVTKHAASPYKGYGVGIDPKYSPHLNFQCTDAEIEEFVKKQKNWIFDYALFCALRDHFGSDDWSKWEEGARYREKKTLTIYKKKLSDQIRGAIATQLLLHREYAGLKQHAQSKNVLLIGDIPFYLSFKSPLVWAHQECFVFDKEGVMNRVSGLPDGPKAHYGRQLWGHPLYDWTTRSKWEEILRLWEIRIEHTQHLFDIARIDHAKGFFTYGSLSLKNSSDDEILVGPGQKVIEKIIDYCRKQNLMIFAEDTGNRLFELRKVLSLHKIPGIKIFRFALDEKIGHFNEGYAKISNYPSSTFAYTSTHDTETLIGYLRLLNNDQRKLLAKEASIQFEKDINRFAVIIRNAIINSPAKMVLIPIQDWILSTQRINTPGTESKNNNYNWQYKIEMPIDNLPTNLF